MSPHPSPANILGSDTTRRQLPDGRIQYVLTTWFITRLGEKDCWQEELGQPFMESAND